MNDELEGIVLRQKEYRESDGLISVLCRDEGKITLVAKGLMKPTSRNRSICSPYSCSLFQLDYDPLHSMFPLKTGNVIESNWRIRENLAAMNGAALICEIVEAISQPQDAIEELYEELKFCLKMLHEGHDVKLTVAYFISRIFKEMGIEPNVDECVLCGDQSITSVSIHEGGFVCHQCSNECETMKLDLASLKMFRWINKAEMQNFSVLEKNLKIRPQDVSVFIEFLQVHSGLRLESKQFFMDCIS